MSIIVIGATFVDIKGYPTDQYIPAGRNVGKVIQVHGGVSRNVAEDIANMELEPTFISIVDNTGLGQDVINKLNKHKCNTDYILKTEEGMGTWLAVFNNDGDVISSISRRPDLLPIYDLLCEKGDEIFAKCDSICLEFDIERPILKKTFELAKKYNKPVFCVISNMSIAVERRDLLKEAECFVCNQQEAGILFSEHYDKLTPKQMADVIAERISSASIKQMVVTMGEKGSVYATADGTKGVVPCLKVDVKDTTGAGDSFFAGVAAGLTYGKTLAQACDIGTRLAASVIVTKDNTCPRFLPSEFGIER